jgi:hypothetical protein
MSDYFYAHIIDNDDIHHQLDILDITDKEKNHLLLIVESSMHHIIVDVLLTEMIKDHHKELFLKHLVDDNHKEIWKVLKSSINSPEEKIIKAVEEMKNDLLTDIRKLL